MFMLRTQPESLCVDNVSFTPLLVPGGWNESACMYACLLVGLMCVSTSSLLVVSKLGPLKILTSKNNFVVFMF